MASDIFLADPPAGAATQYELLMMFRGLVHHGLTILPPSPGESWRLAFLVHCSAISMVLDPELQQVAAEGGGVEERTVRSGAVDSLRPVLAFRGRYGRVCLHNHLSGASSDKES